MKDKKKKKNKLPFLIIPLAILAFAIDFTHWVGLFPFALVNTSLPKNDYSNFLRLSVERNPKIKTGPINRVAFLGTHDSFSYNINLLSKPNPNEPDNLSNAPVANIIGKGLMMRFARAQAHSVLDQLEKGVRFLDVRITYVDNVFYTSHGFISETLEQSVLQVLEFLDKNPGEVIFFQIFHNFLGNANIDQERDEFARIKYNNKNIYDFVNYNLDTTTDFKTLNYNELTSNGTKGGIILFDRLNYQEGKYKEYFKLTPALNRSGKNYYHPNDLKATINDHYNQLPELDNQLTVNNIAYSPSTKGWWLFLTRGSLLSVAEWCNDILTNDEDFDKYLTKMPIVACDFATQTKNDYNIKINEKLLAYNAKLEFD